MKLWPLFRYASSGAQDELHWTALGPFIEFTRTAETRDLYVRPLLHLHQQRGATPGDRADILYPLAASRWDPDHESFRFLLFTYRTSPPPGAAGPEGRPPPIEQWASRLTVPPFVFYRHGPEGGTRQLPQRGLCAGLELGDPGGTPLEDFIHRVKERLTHQPSFECFGGHLELAPPVPSFWEIDWRSCGP